MTSITLGKSRGGPDELAKEDRAAFKQTGVSPLQNPLLREVLLAMTFSATVSRERTSQVEDVLCFLAIQGRPPAPHQGDIYADTCAVLHFIREGPNGGGPLMPRSVTALLRNGWWRVTEHNALFSIFRAEHKYSKDQIELFDTIIEISGGEEAFRSNFNEQMQRAVQRASIEVLQHIFEKIPLQPTIPRWRADQLVPYCIATKASPADDNMIKLLLDLGLDVDAEAMSPWGGMQTALHGAADQGKLDAVKLLWSRGAKVYWDSFNRNPLDRAKQNGHKAVVAFLEAAFNDKGIPHDFGVEHPLNADKEAYREECRRQDEARTYPPRWWQFWRTK